MKLINVSETEWETESILLKEKISASMNAKRTIQPCHVEGYQPHPYLFALNQIFVMLI